MKKLLIWMLPLCVWLAACNPSTEKDQPVSDLETLNRKILDNPNDASLYYQRSKMQAESGLYEAAIKDIDRSLKLDSTKADVYFTAGEAYFHINQTRQSRDAFEKCVRLKPDHVEALLKLAELYLYVKGYPKSVEYADQVLKIDKHQSKAYMLKGLDFKMLGDTAKAISSFQTAVEQNPDYYDAYMQLGLLSGIQHNPLAIDYYDNALRLDPVSIEAMYGKAMFYQQNGHVNQALEVYNQILTQDSRHLQTHYNLGYIYANEFKKYALAKGFFEDALKVDSTYLKAEYMIGYCDEMLGFDDKAVEIYSAVLKKDATFQLATDGLRRLGF
ncbi:MAG: tetratricopeptide repeat protein [Flavobacteriales bacterium]|nr:tetratricopeptide repeat protein [Flavobacteriales bacterium]MCB9447650.1 tetratricopeptide repeat protein [Flavobacteriales bacterium]